MPIYMDVHIVPGVKALDVAEAHRKDLMIQQEHECKCITYWIDEERENIFCLIEAPSKEAVNAMHGKAHGLIPNKIIEVNSNVVVSFLGRLYDPANAEITDDGLKVFHDPSFRAVMVIKLPDAAILRYKVGDDEATRILDQCHQSVREALKSNGGHEVEQKGPGFICSFPSASKAVASALEMISALDAASLENIRIGISAGEPVAESDSLFGDCIQLAEYMCCVNGTNSIVISPEVNELASKDIAKEKHKNILALTPQDESLLNTLYKHLHQHWQDPDYHVGEICDAMAMSQSQLYRKTMSVCGCSTVSLIKDFRLEQAKALMRQQRYNISEITFASGFTSPSYFTKCFKKKYGLLPMSYLDLLH
jgi:AraC-like DNA-binding protein